MATPTFPETPRNGGAGSGDSPVSALLTAVAAGTVRPSDVARLSDLDRAGVGELSDAWPLIPEAIRVGLVQMMDELAEDRVELNFGRALRVALDDPSPVVRQLAVASLWEDEGADVGDRLLRMLTDEPSEDVRAEAAKGLGRFADLAARGEAVAPGDVRTALLEVAEDDREPYAVRRRALEAVGVFGDDPRVRAAIADFYGSDDQGFQGSALFAMGRSLDPRWLSTAVAELESPEAELRYEAARACGALGDASAIPTLLSLASDDDGEVRHAAIQAIGQIGGRPAVRVLEALADEADEADAELIDAAREEAEGIADPLRVDGRA